MTRMPLIFFRKTRVPHGARNFLRKIPPAIFFWINRAKFTTERVPRVPGKIMPPVFSTAGTPGDIFFLYRAPCCTGKGARVPKWLSGINMLLFVYAFTGLLGHVLYQVIIYTAFLRRIRFTAEPKVEFGPCFALCQGCPYNFIRN